VIGENEMATNTLTIKNLHSGEERSGTISELMNFLDV
jgi:histidyl-tRNA synthetase